MLLALKENLPGNVDLAGYTLAKFTSLQVIVHGKLVHLNKAKKLKSTLAHILTLTSFCSASLVSWMTTLNPSPGEVASAR